MTDRLTPEEERAIRKMMEGRRLALDIAQPSRQREAKAVLALLSEVDSLREELEGAQAVLSLMHENSDSIPWSEARKQIEEGDPEWLDQPSPPHEWWYNGFPGDKRTDWGEIDWKRQRFDGFIERGPLEWYSKQGFKWTPAPPPPRPPEE